MSASLLIKIVISISQHRSDVFRLQSSGASLKKNVENQSVQGTPVACGKFAHRVTYGGWVPLAAPHNHGTLLVPCSTETSVPEDSRARILNSYSVPLEFFFV